MITKELLSEVLGYKINKNLGANSHNLLIYSIYPNQGDEPSDYTFTINIYELAHKVKKWIDIKGYVFIEDTRGFCKISRFGTDERKFWEDEEYNFTRVFEAGQWILENKDDQNNNDKNTRAI